MKINDDIIKMNTYIPMEVSTNVESNSNSGSQTNKIKNDTAKFSISGKASSQKITIPVKKINTAGLIITDLKISSKDNEGTETTVDATTATVSNEKSALGASENRLGGNTKSIDNAPKNMQSRDSKVRDMDIAKEMMKLIKKSTLEQPINMGAVQANSSYEAVLQLLR